MRNNVLHLLRPVPLLFILGLPWVSPQIAGATSPECKFQLRGGALPVIATSFEIREDKLLAKVGKSAKGMESRLSSKLAESFRCISQTRFLDWLPMQAGGSDHAGMLSAYLDVDGNGTRFGINLRFEYVIDAARPLATVASLWKEQLYSPEKGHEPGSGGAYWEKDIAALFKRLGDNQGFGNKLAGAFSIIPIKRSEDLLSDKKVKLIGIPIREEEFEAKEGTEITISIRTPDDVRHDVDLTTKRCVRHDGAWNEKVQGPPQGPPDKEIALLRSRRFGPTTIHVKKYEWDYPLSCAQRYPTINAH
jgi:hypothetical protein